MSFPWRVIWLIARAAVFVQFIKNFVNKLFPNCVNPQGERFFREEWKIFSAAANQVERYSKPHRLLEGFGIWRRWVVGGLDLF